MAAQHRFDAMMIRQRCDDDHKKSASPTTSSASSVAGAAGVPTTTGALSGVAITTVVAFAAVVACSACLGIGVLVGVGIGRSAAATANGGIGGGATRDGGRSLRFPKTNGRERGDGDRRNPHGHDCYDYDGDYFYYDGGHGRHRRKTNSYMPFMPALDGYVKSHNTYRFLTVREQVLTVIGEAKHGLWRYHESGIVRAYRRRGSPGVPVDADVTAGNYSSAEGAELLRRDYAPYLPPGNDTGDEAGWGGYRYTPGDDGDGRAAFVDVDIYHPYFEGRYEDHVAIDLPQWVCVMSGSNFRHAKRVWEFVVKQPNANKVGPLGQRAGLDVRELYTNVVRFDLFPDANLWIQVGMGLDASRDVFDQADIDERGRTGGMAMDLAYRRLDLSRVDVEVYLFERPSYNVPSMSIVVVMDSGENDHLRYVRPDGPYWDGLVERGLHVGLKTNVTFDPVLPVFDGGVGDADGDGGPDGGDEARGVVNRTMRYTPLYGVNHLDRPHDDGSGGWCPQRGGDWGYYPYNPAGAGFPNQYQEITPVCDGLVVDVKLWANLDDADWTDPTFQLQNAGTGENPQVYLGEGNQYGDFTDQYLVETGMVNPHALHFTKVSDPDPELPVQRISVAFEAVGRTSRYVDPVTGEVVPADGAGLTPGESAEREERIAASEAAS